MKCFSGILKMFSFLLLLIRFKYAVLMMIRWLAKAEHTVIDRRAYNNKSGANIMWTIDELCIELWGWNILSTHLDAVFVFFSYASHWYTQKTVIEYAATSKWLRKNVFFLFFVNTIENMMVLYTDMHICTAQYFFCHFIVLL